MNLEDKIRACQKCPLYVHMPFSPIPGFGNKTAKIMLIGEAPGKDEAIIEEPFVGRCGKFMDMHLLTPAGLTRSDLFISNVVKCMCRNGNKNRKPRIKEIDACKDWITEEIKEIQPKVIIPLGDTAAKYLNFHGKMDDIVGLEIGSFTFGSNLIHILPSFHPSYLMQYSRDKTERSLQVFKRAKELSEC